MRGTISDDSGQRHRVDRIWVADDSGTMHEVVRAWVGDAQGVPRIWFDKDAVLELLVTATPLDYQRVALSWVLGPQGEIASEYRVHRDGILVQTLTGTTWMDTGLTAGTTYSYRVDAVQNGLVTVSGTASATTDAYIPPAVVDITATTASYTQVNLTWTVSGADSFVVKRGNTVLATTGTSYSDTNLNAGTLYSYSITGYKAGATDATDTATATTTAWPAFSMSASTASYVQINTSWTSLGSGWSYNLKRSGGTIYSGTGTSFSDTGLAGGTSYSYTTEAIWGGAVRKTASASATTTAWPGFSMSASATAWNNIATSWSNLGGGWSYNLYGNGAHLYAGTGTGYNHGVGENTGVNYQTDAIWGGAVRKQATAYAATGSRPTSTGYAKTGYSRISSGGWTQSTQCNPNGGNLSFPVGGTMTSMTLAAWGYSGSNARIEPWVGGAPRMHTIVGPGANSTSTWNTIGLENIGFVAGTYGVGMRTGGSSPGISDYGRTEWDTWSPYSDYKQQVYIDGINYWYYSGLQAVEEMRVHPWWRDDLEEAVENRSLHIETTADQDGNYLTARITDKQTGDVLVDWEREA